MKSSVGDSAKKAVNRKEDVLEVRGLLATVPPDRGGSPDPIDLTSPIADAMLVALIYNLQQRNLSPKEYKGLEGVVVPGTPTHRILVVRSEEGRATINNAVAEAIAIPEKAKKAAIEASKQTTLNPKTWILPALHVRDTRIKGGGVKAEKSNIKSVDSSIALSDAVDWVRNRVDELWSTVVVHIYGHGYTSMLDTELCVAGKCLPGQRGGFGVQFCKDDINLSTVTAFSKWKGYVNRIVMHSCAAADVAPGHHGKHGDGRKLMLELAKTTGATVIASGTIQWYNGGSMENLYKLDFGEWEGSVFRFQPDGTVKLLVKNKAGKPS